MPKIKCPTCGKGTVALKAVSPALDQTMTDVLNHPGLTPPDAVDWYHGIGVTAVNQRLNRLMELGLVRRERQGKAWRYFPTKP